MEDGHSGFSFGFTKNILIRLMDGLPLSPITEDDFKDVEGTRWGNDNKVTYQCPRMSSLFKHVYDDGTVEYSDVNRYYVVDENGNTYTGGGVGSLCDKLFPISLPYNPSTKKYEFHTEDFLLDPKNGDFDHKAVLYVKTPDGDKIELDEYYKEINGKMVKISKDEYFIDRLLKENGGNQ